MNLITDTRTALSAGADLPSTIRRTAETDPRMTALTYVDYSTDRDGRSTYLTYGELEVRVRTVGRELRDSLAPGARVGLLCPGNPDYVVGFLACLYAGMIAVPLFAPEFYRRGDRLSLVIEDCRCEALLTSRSAREAVAEIPLATPVRLVCVDDIDPDGSAPWRPERPDPAATAYLQYTSGSTRHPVGVRVSHQNMAAAVGQLSSCLGIDRNSKVVTWLPLFHDMGLVFSVILPLARGFPVVHMAPFAFVQRPRRWLRLLSEHGATHTVSPNFGLDLCVDRVPEEQRAGLDLSRLTWLGNGSEPVRAGSLARFTDAYEPYGFRPVAHSPAYGLAEATLMVTGNGAGQAPPILSFDRTALSEGRVRRSADGDEHALTLVGCGPPVHQEVRIVDPASGRPVVDEVGEIWVRGDNVCAGYWGRDEGTDQVFGARLDGEPGWLRTGDLGFFYKDSLFITGRSKDLIVIDGRNHHPIDIEMTVEEESPAVRHGHVAAFAVDSGDRERLVIVAEARPDAAGDLAEQRIGIRRAVAARHDVNVDDIVFLNRGGMPKTSSGKLQRRTCRERYENGSLAVIGS
ncbi:fatty acyl-AMP ligase [Actinomadura sp. SCN-SB]|uniref:fatty acyl-AMP ligase n=1 Tax=Actinomadura sp. SCN-SB TaxID=3373092 RepID=UPI00375182CB